MYPVHEVARMTGLTPSVLRVWESRYGWPKPDRGPNGYRLFPRWLVNDLIRVKALMDAGTPLGEIIMDGAVHFPTKQVPHPRKVAIDFSTIPSPRTSTGQALRMRIERAILDKSEGVIAEIIALLPTIHPDDRDVAVRLPLFAAGRMVP